MLVSYLSFLFDEFELVVICAIEMGQPKWPIFTCIAMPMEKWSTRNSVENTRINFIISFQQGNNYVIILINLINIIKPITQTKEEVSHQRKGFYKCMLGTHKSCKMKS